MRKIAVVTGTRAEYGLLYWIIKGIYESPDLELQLIVTGAHLSHEFGLTVMEIEADGFPIIERVEMLLSSDTEESIVTSMGLGMIGFAKAYERLRPDILLVLGDRFEIHSAVASAIPFRIPVAHIAGGEVTEGAMDESFRHSITKMSHLHFPANQEYAARITQMGELENNVFCVGVLGRDNMFKLNLLDKQQLAQELQLPYEKKWGIVTYHPVTLEKDSAETQIMELLKGLCSFTDMYWILTSSNADMENRIIIKNMEQYVKDNIKKAKLFNSLGQLKYLSVLKNADLMVGNSSSGLVEAPSFELPVVDIGDRQKGRVSPKNVINVSRCEKNVIVAAINQAISNDFRKSLKGLRKLYGEAGASEKIVNKLKSISLDANLIKKRFYDAK
jgi:UDP-hydrolysing UDP-N-acetyl-D-glucosamine 2-epimerase|tara:strand:+ start:260 stop:1423 length:1164 start_codon:yes stop_codon:yes gene_type:complete